MKRFSIILISVVMLACALTACSSGDKKSDEKTTAATTVASTKGITTDNAKITELDAIALIREQYTAKELGLSEEEYKKACDSKDSEASFMVANSGEKIKNDYYVKVVCVYKIPHQAEDGTLTYTFDNKGVYYIRFDGKQILREDIKTGKYSELEVRKVPESTTSKQTTHAQTKTTAKPKKK